MRRSSVRFRWAAPSSEAPSDDGRGLLLTALLTGRDAVAVAVDAVAACAVAAVAGPGGAYAALTAWAKMSAAAVSAARMTWA
jgi:hypothetical protein